MCQKAFGNLFGAFFGVQRDRLTWETGEPAYFQSSRIARRGFCRDCGTPLSFEYRDRDEKVHLSVGRLDEPDRELLIPDCVGPNGNVAPLLTAWALDPDNDLPHLSTAFPRPE
jgi:hypothetical protein